MTPTVPTPYTQSPEQLILTLIRAGWTQEQIAAAADISQPTVCRIYSGKRADPRYSVVEKLRRLVLNLDEFQVAA
jgi:predicted transcriptional regulator